MAIALKRPGVTRRHPGLRPRPAPADAGAAGRRVIRLLLSAVLRYRWRTIFALTLGIAAKLATVAVPVALKEIVDQLGSANGSDAAPATLPAFLLLGYAALRFLADFFGEIRNFAFARVTQDTVTGYLMRSFIHLHRQSVRFHAVRRTGGTTRDIERGTQGIGFLLGLTLFTALPTLVEILAVATVIAIGYSAWFVLIILATLLGYAAFTVIYTDRHALYQRTLNKLDAKASAQLADSLRNFEAVKYYTNERFEHLRLGSLLDRSAEVALRNQKSLSTLHIVQGGIVAVGVAALMLLAGQSVVTGHMSVGDLVLVNAYAIQLCLPLNAAGFIFRQARDAVADAADLFRLMDEKPEIQDEPDRRELELTKGSVRFEHVDFAYEPDRIVLRDISFVIPPGRSVALVGGRGAGKSTLARLMFRFHDATRGRVRIDGQDVRDVSQRSLRAAIGIVPQEALLFNDSVAYNIAYGRAGARMPEVIEAAKAAQAHDFITRLPEGYDTLVGERGVTLSASERQRIAIARVILKNPPILVIDAATAMLDTQAERAVQEALDRLAQTRTTLVIAHRLSTVVDVDEILVLENGRIVERGRHDALLDADGVYARMWRMQLQQRALDPAERKEVQLP
jgi:ATP-binding cassette subfamily B protein